MKVITIIVLWSLASVAYATEFCQTLAEEARLAASLRDDGFTREQYVRQVAINISDDNLTADGYKLVANVTKIVAAQVFLYPHNTPTEEANMMHRRCEEAR